MPERDKSELNLLPRHLSMLQEVLMRSVPSAEVWAYGSRVNGTSHETSDLDLVVRNPGDPAKESPGLPALRAALSDSNLPLLVDVADWARIPERFRREIEAGYVVVWGKTG